MNARVADSAVVHRGTDSVDVPVSVEYQPMPRYRGIIGRAVTRYVVGVDGRAEPGTLTILLASSPVLVEEARWVLPEIKSGLESMPAAAGAAGQIA